MEVKINREIRNYTESMFFGLSMRQFVFSLLAVGVAVGLYYLLRPHFGMETVRWMVILAAAPFAMLGFLSYHGMTAEQFIRAWLRSELIEPKQLRVETSNLYYEALKDTIETHEKEVYRLPMILTTAAGTVLAAIVYIAVALWVHSLMADVKANVAVMIVVMIALGVFCALCCLGGLRMRLKGVLDQSIVENIREL